VTLDELDYSREGTKTYYNIYKTIQGRELTHTQYLQSCSGKRTNTYRILTKLFRGEKKHIYNIYKTIQERELTHTTIFTKLYQGRELTLTTIFTKLLRGEN
jgi:hypothetical protein